MTERTLFLRFSSLAALEEEMQTNLLHGRAFVKGAVDAQAFPLFSEVLLALEHPENARVHKIPCQVVMVLETPPHAGIAVQFASHTEATVGELRAFVESDLPLALPALDEAPEPETSELAQGDGSPNPALLNPSPRERLRNLSALARTKVAQGPSLEDRVQLERLYGAAVWESLLRNPKVTIPEVASMARKGTMPRPLLDLICDNDHWVRQSPVRRALLSNPRLSPEGASKVLRTLPARELKLVPQQTAYPANVRAIAQRLLRNA